MAGSSSSKKDRKEPQSEVFQAPVIQREPASRQAKLGSRVVIRVVAAARPLPSYQWFHNGQKIVGANSDRLTIMKIRRTQIGAYHCEVKNFVGKAASRPCMISVFAAREQELVIGPAEIQAEAGKPFSLKVLSPPPAELRDVKIYWTFNGMRIKGANGLELRIGEAKKKYEGEYKAVISTGGTLESSNVARVLVVPARPKGAAVPPPLPAMEAPVPPKREVGWSELVFDPEEEQPAAEAVVDPAAEAAREVLLRKKAFLEALLEGWRGHCAERGRTRAA